MGTQTHQAVVLGGGPAGAAAAIILALENRNVVLVKPTRPAAGALAESIPPSARRILDEIGVLSALERGPFQPNLGNRVWWAGSESRTEDFEHGEGGFHVDRAGLEEVLAAAARDAGVTVLTGVAARTAVEVDPGWEVSCEGEDGRRFVVAAPWLLDATGRRGLIATREGRRPDRSTTTVALLRRWRRPGGWTEFEPGRTLVESYEDGWAWSVPLGPETRCLTAMVDPRHVDLSGSAVEAALDGELDKAERMGRLREGAEASGPAWACPASLYTSERFGRPGLLLVGDAGSFIDPLSSFGVKKALSSGWLAAVVIHTVLGDPSMTRDAVDFFHSRESRVYRSYRAHSASFFESAATFHGHPYWKARAEAARTAAGEDAGRARSPLDPDAPPIPPDEVQSAFESIRRRERLHAVPGGTLRSVRRPAVRGRRLRMEEHPASDRCPEGVRWVRGVDLRRVVEVAPEHEQVPDGWRAYNAGSPDVALPDYLSALAAAFAAGLLEHGAE